MPERSDLVYLYDGSYEGLLCCIFESYDKKELPFDIRPEFVTEMTFNPTRFIQTDFEKASRVSEGITKKVSPEALYQVELGYYTCRPHKERLILDFVRLAMCIGKNIMTMLTDETVNGLLFAVKAMEREAHQLKGFIRFSIYNNAMAAVIEPKNFVLPLLKDHFCDRYHHEAFMIYDKAHGCALVYQNGKSMIFSAEEYTEPEADSKERMFRSLWKLFYDTIAIKERENPRCRMSHMQKRYWKHMTEMDSTNKRAEQAEQQTKGEQKTIPTLT